MPVPRTALAHLIVAMIAGLGLALVACGGAATETSPGAGPAGDAAGRSVVVGIADGDTAFVEIDGVRETVRLVGIDAPESDGPYREPGCFGAEASARLRELLPSGERVRIETDPAQDPRDRFDRLLGYVFRDGDEISVNQRLVAEGMARVYVYRADPFSLAEEFRRSEDEARSRGRGLWAACGSGARPGPAAGARDCPPDTPIKGNLPSGIYHSPGDENYEQTTPERCFADGDAAEAAGFRAAAR